MIKFLDLKSQYSQIKVEVDAAIHNVIEKATFIGGEQIKQLEKDFASYQDANYCIGVANGTDALEIAIEALGLPNNSEIIVPANSFVASSEAVTRAGHKVVFCDCDPHNYTIDLKSVVSVLTKNTRAVIAVHLYGHPCDMDGLKEIADEHGLFIIEDCAQAHGAEYKGTRVGAIGTIGAFSFYPGKNLGAYGDGGAILTNSSELATKCRMIANHGRIEKYNHQFEGRNSRLDNLQAAILNVKLKYLDNWTNKRIEIADFYLSSLLGVKEISLPKREEWAKQVYHVFVIRTKLRDELANYLNEHGIQTGVHYPIALPKLEAYNYLKQDCSTYFAYNNDAELLSLPMGEHLTKEDAWQVANAIKAFFE
ncbi:DegT/DnrJ/EryC1/StrS family aminotransferase [Flagellimonas aequoris]|uniref:DegT/DnrJ/EryC1/StrS family aminotransferase n=1 Tax=Flagellimonas aequoris TaxID=2306997 RepID=A0A418NAA0_9FLAO|nr:DegT/DnrJ/EryC1/StrS family aminotransferase [Allomuricauda aequoris]RIV72555.1 DegT/DnrJ/EryC1/StrS family aminotransferase [Allomuricauda aequoris]TXK05055.1 DegT/DnrJ/EryC1/StrS family aminotransferase [Allomuricauda aequoris]